MIKKEGDSTIITAPISHANDMCGACGGELRYVDGGTAWSSGERLPHSLFECIGGLRHEVWKLKRQVEELGKTKRDK